MKNKSVYLICVILSLITLTTYTSCISEDDETIAPKPRSYFRLAFPKKEYVKYDSLCPFTFEIPTYARMDRDPNAHSEPCWLNLNFPSFNGTLHLSYKEVEGSIEGLLKDSYTLASKHQIKASGMVEQLIAKDSSKVYGLIYEIEGNAASSIQFYLTDSVHHFVRGALYFNEVPNIDSIAPVISFIKEDIHHIFETFEWK
jgi:gliding motility-associated lipoprotein GldD